MMIGDCVQTVTALDFRRVLDKGFAGRVALGEVVRVSRGARATVLEVRRRAGRAFLAGESADGRPWWGWVYADDVAVVGPTARLPLVWRVLQGMARPA